METMMALGNYRFSLQHAAYQTLRRSQSFRWETQARLSARPARQFIGLGDDTLELTGTLYPHFRGGLTQLESLRAEALKGEPLLLVDGEGLDWGRWVVLQLQQEHTTFMPNGQPLKQTFTLRLAYYGNAERT